jgi:hypothetical protein
MQGTNTLVRLYTPLPAGEPSESLRHTHAIPTDIAWYILHMQGVSTPVLLYKPLPTRRCCVNHQILVSLGKLTFVYNAL